MYGESLLSGQATDATTPATNDYEESELSDMPRAGGRGNRSSGRLGELNGERKRKEREGYNDVDQMSEEDDAASSAGWNSDDNEDDGQDDIMDEEDDVGLSEEEEEELEPQSLVVKLKVRQPEDATSEQKAPIHEDSAMNGVESTATSIQADSMMRPPENDENVLGYIKPMQDPDHHLPDSSQHEILSETNGATTSTQLPISAAAEKPQIPLMLDNVVGGNPATPNGNHFVANGHADTDMKMVE